MPRPTGFVTVLTHDNFSIPDATIKTPENDSCPTVKFAAAGEGAALVNQLVLAKDAPLSDGVCCMDNTLAPRVGDAGLLFT